MLFSVSNGGCINERKTTCEIRFTNDERRKCLAGIASLWFDKLIWAGKIAVPIFSPAVMEHSGICVRVEDIVRQ